MLRWRRLAGLVSLIGFLGIALTVGGPRPAVVAAAARDPAGWAEQVGTDTVAMTVAALACWLVWLCLTVGVLVTAATAVPGAAGSLARAVADRCVPASLRRLAALALGISLGVVVAGCARPTAAASPRGHPATASPSRAASPTGADVAGADAVPTAGRAGRTARAGRSRVAEQPRVDWPLGATGSGRAEEAPSVHQAVPQAPLDWPLGPVPGSAGSQPVPGAGVGPGASATGDRRRPARATGAAGRQDEEAAPANADVVVASGDCLWLIAARRLGASATDSRIAVEAQRWYAANRAVVGADPDLIHPGQTLVTPP